MLEVATRNEARHRETTCVAKGVDGINTQRPPPGSTRKQAQVAGGAVPAGSETIDANAKRDQAEGMTRGTQAGDELVDRRTLWQRLALRRLRRLARKGKGQQLSPDDWAALWDLNNSASARVLHRLLRMLPAGPRCGLCSAPFAGAGRFVVRPLA
jgi:hypothetical protein